MLSKLQIHKSCQCCRVHQSTPEMDQIFKSSKMISVTQKLFKISQFFNAVFQSGSEITLHASA